MRIRLLKPYGFSRAGEMLEPDDPVAQLLIDRGIAEAVETKELTAPAGDKGMEKRAAKGKPRCRPPRRR